MPFDFSQLFKRPEDDEDNLNIAAQPLPVALSQPPEEDMTPPPEAAAANSSEPYKIQSPLVQDYISKLYGDKYSNENREKLQQSLADDASGPNWGAALASLGAGFQGNDAGAAGEAYLKSQQAGRDSQLKAFDAGRAGLVDSQKLGMSLRDDAQSQEKLDREKNPTSRESMLAQTLASKMVPGKDFSQMSASQINGLLPGITKIYEIEQKKIDRADARADKLAAKTGGATEGRKAADKDYAKDYNDWTSTGRSSLEKNLEALEEAKKALETDPSLTGGLTGVAGDRFTADRVLKQRQKVGSAIQGSLRATLGPQFTEKEGERILKNAYNEAASAKTNIESIDALIKQQRAQAAINDEKARHFEKTGSLVGFQGIPVSKKQANWPKQLRKDGKVATVNNDDELKEATAEGWS